jgi:hypothetical protein
MLRILTNDPDPAFALDDFAFFTYGFYRWSHFHAPAPPPTDLSFFRLAALPLIRSIVTYFCVRASVALSHALPDEKNPASVKFNFFPFVYLNL